jgi:hypothetical protein
MGNAKMDVIYKIFLEEPDGEFYNPGIANFLRSGKLSGYTMYFNQNKIRRLCKEHNIELNYEENYLIFQSEEALSLFLLRRS